MKRLTDMIASFLKPVANAQVQPTTNELAHEKIVRRRLARRRERLAVVLADYRRQDGELSR